MKKLTSTLGILFVIGLTITTAQCCTNSKDKSVSNTQIALAKSEQKNAVKAYYFHATRRCATCEAVELVTKEALKEYYGDKISFESINREEEKDNPMIEKYKISGQTLLIIKGNKVVNLTNEAFMNARTNPDKFKAKLKSTVDSLL